MIHELKILPQYFKEVSNGNKTFELRKNDRNYKIGDTLLLLEFNNGHYTGNYCNRKITYILLNYHPYGLAEGFLIMAIK